MYFSARLFDDDVKPLFGKARSFEVLAHRAKKFVDLLVKMCEQNPTRVLC